MLLGNKYKEYGTEVAVSFLLHLFPVLLVALGLR
jgi:hypothetical protein